MKFGKGDEIDQSEDTMVDIKISKEAMERMKTVRELQFSHDDIEKIGEANRRLALVFGSFGSIANIPGLPAEAQCVQDGHKVIRITGNMYQCRICAREFAHVGQMDTGELWREFWRRVNAKRMRFWLMWMFDEFFKDMEKAQGWRIG